VDEDVLDAIRFHTTGKSNWNAVGCALYIADFCEPGRPYPEAAFAHKMMTEQGFAPTLHFVAKTKTDHVRNIHDIDPNSEAFLRWIQTEYPV
jgi:HD superfamily phosphohydrolase YqeK